MEHSTLLLNCILHVYLFNVQACKWQKCIFHGKWLSSTENKHNFCTISNKFQFPKSTMTKTHMHDFLEMVPVKYIGHDPQTVTEAYDTTLLHDRGVTEN